MYIIDPFIVLAAEQTAARVPHPFSADPVSREDTIPAPAPAFGSFEDIPGYDEFDEAISMLRIAVDYASRITPKDHNVNSVIQICQTVATRITSGLKELLRSLPPELLTEAKIYNNYKTAQKIIEQLKTNKPVETSVIGNINYLITAVNTMKDISRSSRPWQQQTVVSLIDQANRAQQGLAAIKQLLAS